MSTQGNMSPREDRPRTRQAEKGGGSQRISSQAELPAIWHLFGDDGLSQRLLVLAKMIERVASRKLQEGFGISVAQWRVLAFVCISGPATASFIGDSAEADPAEISRAVKALVGRNLVAREFKPGNRKTMVIAPTTDGRTLFAEIRRQRQDYFSRITRRLPPSRRTSLSLALTQIAEEVVAERAETPVEGLANRGRPERSAPTRR